VVVTDGLVDGVIGTEDAWVLDPEDVFDRGNIVDSIFLQ
jgi:hypothetical protein